MKFGSSHGYSGGYNRPSYSPRAYDDWKVNGYWHKCPDCGSRYSDSDGACGCQDEREEETEIDEEDE